MNPDRFCTVIFAGEGRQQAFDQICNSRIVCDACLKAILFDSHINRLLPFIRYDSNKNVK